MITTTAGATLRGRHLAIALSLLTAAQLHGQAVANPALAADLTKYDANKNGVLDAAELAKKAADEGKDKETVLLTPFQVSTEKDVGYAASNTLSGGRVDTPLEITPGSIQVI